MERATDRGGETPDDGSGRDALTAALRRCRGAFASVLAFSLAINLLMLAGPLYMLQVYDRVLQSGSVETLGLLTAMLAATILAMATLETLRSALTVRIGIWLDRTLGPAFLDSGLRARLAGRGVGAQPFRDITQVQSFVATQGLTAFVDAPWTPLYIALIWLLHPWLGMLAAAAALVLLGLGVLNDRATRRPLADAGRAQLAAHGLAGAAIDNAESVRAMGMAGALRARWSDRNAAAQRDMLTASERGGLVTGAVKFIRTFTQSAILGLGALLVIEGDLTPGVMVAASILLGRALAPIDVAMSAWRNFSAARQAWGRLRAHAADFPPEPRRMSLPPPRGALEIEDLTVQGPHGSLLHRVAFAAEPGEAIAVVGPSGAGKSTLCRCLVGLVRPDGGAVRLDRTDLTHWDSEELGRHVGFLSQDVGLFAGTIRENIARMAEAPDEAVIEAARLAHAHDMIATMPAGYATRIGDRGAGLSAGQRQRVGLARALFGRPALVVLDEPNANLDQAGETALSAAIETLKRRGTVVIIVGHRPSTFARCDRVLALRGGRVNVFGPRDAVVERLREAGAARIAGRAAASSGGPQPARGADDGEAADARPRALSAGAEAAR